MRHYVAVQMNIDQWRRRNKHVPYISKFKEAKELSISSMSQLLFAGVEGENKAFIPESHLQENDIVNETTVELVVTALVDLAALQSNHTITWTPHYSCPIPCEYRYTVWRNLFIASTILNICLFLAVVSPSTQLKYPVVTEAVQIPFVKVGSAAGLTLRTLSIQLA